MATQSTMTTRKTAPPTFAVQRAGGGKARITALYPRLTTTEAVTVTTVSNIGTAKRIAHLLGIAWNSGFGPFHVTDPELRDLAGLPDPVAKAIEDALVGCPPRGDRFGDERTDAADKARLVADFGPAHTACQNMSDEDDEAEDCEALLTPRQALRLRGHLVLLGDGLTQDLNDRSPLDAVIGPADIFDADDLPVGAQPQAWWDAFRLAFFDLAADIKAGDNPVPATFAEIVALHMAVSVSQADDAGDEKNSVGAWVWGERHLPEYGCDRYGWEDELLLGLLFDDLIGGNDLIDCVENGVDFYDMVPADQWHHPLPGMPQRDPSRLLE